MSTKHVNNTSFSKKKKNQKQPKWIRPIVLRRPRILMHSHGLRERNISTADVLSLTVACESKSCIVFMVCVICLFFFLFFLFFKHFNFFFLLSVEIVTNFDEQGDGIERTECETKPRYYSQDPLSCTGFTGQQMRALALDLPISPSCILYG